MRLGGALLVPTFALRVALAGCAAFALSLAAGSALRSEGPAAPAGERPLSLPLPELSLGGLPGGTAPSAGEHSGIAERYGRLPLAFEQNRGHTDGRVDYLARAAGQMIFLTPTGATLALKGEQGKRGAAIRLAFAGANARARASGLERKPGSVSYLKGERSEWRGGIPTYGRVQYESIYPGIDLAWYGTNGGRLEYDFLLAPGADPDRIALRIEGAERVSLTSRGAVRIETAAGSVTQRPPVAYQQLGGQRRPVESRYRLDGHRVALALGSYDRSRPLVIDPVLAYSSYLGGGSSDSGQAIAVDSAGSAYVTGPTYSSDFPTTTGAFEESDPPDSSDAFVSKLSPDGSELVYSSYLGGNGDDSGQAIAVDSAGSAYVTGEANSNDFPTTPGAFEEDDQTGSDAFASKLSPDGSELVYSSYLGGGGSDTGQAIAVDSAGSAYVTGQANSSDFPTTAGAFQQSDQPAGDAFASKLSPEGSELVYSSYLGGNGNDLGQAIAVDSAGSAYVTGQANSSDFPTTAGAFQESDRPDIDAFASKFAPDGSELAYSSYLGGNDKESGRAIAVDSAGSAYVTGPTDSSDFPTTGGAFQESDRPDTDAFASKLSTGGSKLAYSSYLGGGGSDSGRAIAVDSAGSAYVTGLTASSDFPTTARAFQSDQPDFDAFASRLSPSGSELAYSSYLGGNGFDFGQAIAVDSAGSAYVAGSTDSTNFPTTAGAFDESSNDAPEDESSDAFVSQLGARADLSLTKSDSPEPVSVGAELNYTLGARNAGPDSALGVRLVDQLPDGVEFVSAQASQGSCDPPSGGQLECPLGNLAAGATATVTIKVRPASAGTITNRAEVSSETSDPAEANNDAEAQTTVQAAGTTSPGDDTDTSPSDDTETSPGDDTDGDDEDGDDEVAGGGGGGELPFTGLTVGALALLGTLMLAGGRALRRPRR